MAELAYKHRIKSTNTGMGVSDLVYFAPIDYFTTIQKPTLPLTPEVPELADLVSINTAHTFEAGKGFIKAMSAPYKNQMTGASIGEVGSRKFDLNFEAFLAGSDAELHGMIAQLNNQPVILLVPDDCGSGFAYQIGSECNPAYLSAEWATGTTKDGQKGYKLTFNTPAKAIQIYTAEIEEYPAV